MERKHFPDEDIIEPVPDILRWEYWEQSSDFQPSSLERVEELFNMSPDEKKAWIDSFMPEWFREDVELLEKIKRGEVVTL